MIKLRLILTFSIIVTTALILPELYGKGGLTRADTATGNSKKQIVRVYFPDRYTANKIFLSFEGMILETNYEKKYHIMAVSPDEMDLLIHIENPTPNITPIGDGGSSKGIVTSGGGGCLIATAAYGSSMEPHVKILREFRDRFLLKNSIGKASANFYYKYSPPLASFIEKHHNLRVIVRLTLFPLVCISWATLRLGLSHSILLMLLFGLGIMCLVRVRRKKTV